MISSPLRTVLAYDDFTAQNSSTLALPSDQKMRNGGAQKEQRVKDQVMHSVRRKSTRGNSTLRYSSRGSGIENFTDTSAVGFNRSHTVAGISGGSYTWGMQNSPQLSNGITTYDKDSKRRFSSYSQMENWMKHNTSMVGSPTSPDSDSAFYYGNMVTSKSEPDLTQVQIGKNRSTTRKSSQSNNSRGGGSAGGGGNVNAQWTHNKFAYSSYQPGTQKRGPIRTISSVPTQKMEVLGNALPNVDQRRGNYPSIGRGITGSTLPYILNGGGGAAGELNIQKAVEMLGSSNPESQYNGSSFIQHATFQDEKAKEEVYRYGGIQKLIQLLSSSYPEVQEATVGALRNSVFKNVVNKLETQKQNGIQEALRLLGDNSSAEIQKQVTGLMWNLSSHDELKDDLITEALPALTNKVIIPFSGWSDGNQIKRNVIDPEVFFNATGCLRNLSSSDQHGRQMMRNCKGLIESLALNVQNCVAANRPDDKSVENCVCILHNLSYHVDAEVPNKYSQLEAERNTQTSPDRSSVGCFSQKSEKVQNNDFDLPVPEEDSNPKGANLLFHSNMIRTYLSLLGHSKKDSTLEACTGALQNLTASKGMMSNATSQIIGLKENGVSQISKLLKSGNPDVQKAASSLLCNMSRHKPLQNVIANQAFPSLSQLFSSGVSGSSKNSDDIISSACYTMRNLMVSNPQIAKQNLNSGLLNTVMSLCRNGYAPKASQAASLFLSDLWGMKELQGLMKQQGVNKNFINGLSSTALKQFQKSF